MNKVAVVTGATGNLGQAVVKKFLTEGYIVVGTTTNAKSESANSDHEKFELVEVDLADTGSATNFISHIIDRHGRIDVTVLTAGGFAMGTIADTSSREIQKQVQLNFDTAYNIAQPVFVQMKKQGEGHIFLTGSRPGLDSRYSKGVVAYSLSKSLLFRLAELMNEEAINTNVVTNVIVPGTIDTPQNRKAMPGEDPSAWVKAEQIAGIIFFHCTQQAAILRGSIIKAYNNS